MASTHVVADITSDRIRPSMDGSRPVDGLMPGALDSVAVQMLLLPIRAEAAALSSTPSAC